MARGSRIATCHHRVSPCSKAPEEIVEIIDAVVETREDPDGVKARKAAEAASVHQR
jgi:hypothetical protein